MIRDVGQDAESMMQSGNNEPYIEADVDWQMTEMIGMEGEGSRERVESARQDGGGVDSDESTLSMSLTKNNAVREPIDADDSTTSMPSRGDVEMRDMSKKVGNGSQSQSGPDNAARDMTVDHEPHLDHDHDHHDHDHHDHEEDDGLRTRKRSRQSQFQETRAANIARNRALLSSIGVDKARDAIQTRTTHSTSQTRLPKFKKAASTQERRRSGRISKTAPGLDESSNERATSDFTFQDDGFNYGQLAVPANCRYPSDSLHASALAMLPAAASLPPSSFPAHRANEDNAHTDRNTTSTIVGTASVASVGLTDKSQHSRSRWIRPAMQYLLAHLKGTEADNVIALWLDFERLLGFPVSKPIDHSSLLH